MLSKSLFSLFSLILLQYGNAEVITPGTGVLWKAGENVTVSWKNLQESYVDVRLVHGDATNLQLALPNATCSNQPGPEGSCYFILPSRIPSGRNYAVTVGKLPEKYVYSSYFTIQGNETLPESEGCPNFGGYKCPKDMPCCSSGGYCGATQEYCGVGCVAKFSFNNQCLSY
ncbi:hypothetical protein K7432_010181 [Basidiobolus ranarum]|uniref:Chitin-binding type-1 domain-containing protein n=1 Tax=Basidiobolus ranarum TaxID=34480 RepID=A0ABR2VVX1_9FUNG